MVKIDELMLRFFNWVSNTMYRKLSIDNYNLALIFFVCAAITSAVIGVHAFNLSLLDKDPRIVEMRKSASIFATFFFFVIFSFLLWNLKSIREMFQRKYDLGKRSPETELPRGLVITCRWIVPFMYTAGIFLDRNEAWGMLDFLTLWVGVMFLSCKPPDMNDRLKKSLDSWKITQ